MGAEVPGQQTLPQMIQDLGYESITNLKANQERFCWEFVLRNGNAGAAYMSAYPNSADISAKANSCRLLKKPEIQKRIEEIKTELRRRYAVDAGSIILFLSQVLNLDRRSLLDSDGNPKPAHELDTETARIVELDFTLDRHGRQRAVYKVPTRMQAATELAQLMGLHKSRVELTGDGAFPENTVSALVREISGGSRDLAGEPTDITVSFKSAGDHQPDASES